MKIFIIAQTVGLEKSLYKTLRYVDQTKPFAKFYYEPGKFGYANYEIRTARNGNNYIFLFKTVAAKFQNTPTCLWYYSEINDEKKAAVSARNNPEFKEIQAKYKKDTEDYFYNFYNWYIKNYDDRNKAIYYGFLLEGAE